jgi:hypothetical protein
MLKRHERQCYPALSRYQPLDLMVAVITLAGGDFGARMLPPVGRERFSHVVSFLELAFRVATDKPFVTARGN